MSDIPVNLDAFELRKLRIARREKIGRWVLPILTMSLSIYLWDWICVSYNIPHYILPRPGRVMAALWADWDITHR